MNGSVKEMNAVKRPIGLMVLIAIQIPFAIMGYASGYGLLSSPSGEGLGLSSDLLENAPVSDFTLVGLFFLAFYGVLPTLAAYGLLSMARWRWTDPLNRWTGQHWGWTASMALGITLLVWIGVEIIFVGVPTGIGLALQVAMTVLGIVIIAIAMAPSVRLSTRLDGR